MKITYWTAICQNDSKVYNIREATKKAVVERLKEYDADSYGKPQKCVIEYANALDLVMQCLGESGAYWEKDEETVEDKFITGGIDYRT